MDGINKVLNERPIHICRYRRYCSSIYRWGLIPALIKTGNGYVININKGLSLPLTKKFLKDLLSQYPDLENEYKKKMSFMDHALEIIQRVNEREILHGKAEKQ